MSNRSTPRSSAINSARRSSTTTNNEILDPEDENAVFDPLSEGRASGVRRLSLLQRGKVIEQLRDELRRKDTYASRRTMIISTAASDASSSVVSPPTSPPLSPTSASANLHRMTLYGSIRDDDTSEALEDLSKMTSATVMNNNSRNALVLQAALSMWSHCRIAAAFRHWKEASRAATDPSSIPESVNLNDEAKRILLSAETARSLMDASPTLSGLNPENMPMKFSRKETDLLVVWAKQMQAKTFSGVDDASIREVMRFLRFRNYQDGESLFYEGDTGDVFYILFHGIVAVYVGLQSKPKMSQAARRNRRYPVEKIDASLLGKRVFTYRTGESFGETAMFTHDATRTASAIAVGPCLVCELSKDVYKRTLRKYHQQFFEQAQKLNFLQRVSLFQNWQRARLSGVADVLEKRKLNFGDSILSEGVSMPPGCFLILSGSVKLLKHVEVPGSSMVTLSQSKWRKPTSSTKAPRHAYVNVELQALGPGEIIALEALMEPHKKCEYSAIAASANVELYLLRESDLRALIGTLQSAFGQKIKALCDAGRDHFAARLEKVKRAFEEQEASREDAQQLMEHAQDFVADSSLSQPQPQLTVVQQGSGGPDSVSPRGAMLLPVGMTATAPPPQTLPSAAFIRGGLPPYLPHLTAAQLFPEASASSALAGPSVSVVDATTSSLDAIAVVSSPKMLSTCSRKFIFQHSDTLTTEYVEKLKVQFPTPVPPTTPLSSRSEDSATTRHTARRRHRPMGREERDEHRVLEQQMKRLYETKMQWDPAKKDFVLLPPATNTGSGSFSIKSSTPVRVHDGPTGSSPMRPKPSMNGPFYHQIRATQESARKIVESHLKKVSQRQTNTHADGSFLHFF